MPGRQLYLENLLTINACDMWPHVAVMLSHPCIAAAHGMASVPHTRETTHIGHFLLMHMTQPTLVIVVCVAEIPEDIMERRCPPMKRFNHGAAHHVRVTTRKRLQPYALAVSLLTTHLYAYVCIKPTY